MAWIGRDLRDHLVQSPAVGSISSHQLRLPRNLEGTDSRPSRKYSRSAGVEAPAIISLCSLQGKLGNL